MKQGDMQAFSMETAVQRNSGSSVQRRNLTFRWILAVLLINLFGGKSTYSVVSAQVLYNNSEAYFGGKDNEPYLEWVNSMNSRYRASAYLPSSEDSYGMAIHWDIVDDERILLAVIVRDSDVDWVGFGLSESGAMPGSDIFTFDRDLSTVTDGYILDEYKLLTDDCQDWQLVSAAAYGMDELAVVRNNTEDVVVSETTEDQVAFLVIEVERLLDTLDTQDRVIGGSSTGGAWRLIGAWGSGTPGYHGQNRVRGGVRFDDFGEDPVSKFRMKMEEQSDGYFEILSNNYAIDTIETEYIDFCVSADDLPSDAVAIIGFEPIISSDSAAFVHHFVVTGSFRSNNGKACDEFEGADTDIFAWAPGTESYAMPDDVGAPMGSGDMQSFKMNVHYDNPFGIANVVDNSGIRFYYTTTPRTHAAGFLALGDLFLAQNGESVGEGLTEHRYSCPSSCSNLALSSPVTVISESLHMHKDGVSSHVNLIRNGEVVHTGKVEFFSFDNQGFSELHEESFEVLPGDSFETVCQYESTSDTVFGLGSSDEMCITFLMYYPRTFLGESRETPWVCSVKPGFSDCDPLYESKDLVSASDLNRTFGSSQGQCQPSSAPTATQTTVPTNQPTATSTLDPTGVENESAGFRACDCRAVTILWVLVLLIIAALIEAPF